MEGVFLHLFIFTLAALNTEQVKEVLDFSH